MSVLALAQQVTGASYLKVAHGDLVSASQIGEFSYRLKTLFRHFRKQLVPAVHKKSICHSAASADTPPQLIQL